MIYAFGPFELDSDLYELRQAGVAVKLAPKAFDVLHHLVRNRDRVVSKADLLDGVWPGEHVTESVLPANVNAIRRALGDERGEPRFVQTVHGRGYRFLEAVEEREAARPAPAAPAGDAFVGRETVLAELRGQLERVLGGRGALVLLAGEPGIGKTRTARELAAAARERGALVLEGGCYEGEGAPAFWPWIQILRDAAAQLDDAALERELGTGAADLARLVPEIRARLCAAEPSAAPDSDEARFRLFESVATFLRNLARRRPLVVLLDDLHWADEPTLVLLRFLAPQLGALGALLVGAYRDVELRRTHPLAQVLGALARAPDLRRITLRGLDRDEVARMAEALSGVAPSDALAGGVHEMTEGNPFFVQEMVRLLADEGRLDEPVDVFSLPQGVREVVGRRLDALDDECNRVLRLASVIGAEFGVQVLEAIAELPRAGLLAALERAQQARIVRAAGAAVGRFAFSHVLIRETLYEELSTTERIALHRRVGEVLETVYGPDADSHLGELSYHFGRAAPGGDVERAVDYTTRAAEHALASFAFEESVQLYERALQVLALEMPVDEARRGELLLGLGRAHLVAGQREATLRALRAAADVARGLGSGELLGRVATSWPPTLGRQMVVWNAEYRPLVDEALGVVDPDALAVRAGLTRALALTPPDSDSMERRRTLSLEAESLARASGDPEALFGALEARLWSLTGPDDTEARLRVASEMVGLAESQGSEPQRIDAHVHRIRSLVLLGRLAEADLEIDVCARLAERLRLPTYRLSAARFQLARAMGDGRLDDAERLIEDCTRWCETMDDPDVDINRALWLVWLAHARGDLPRFAGFFEPFVEQTDDWIGATGRYFVAWFYACIDRLDDARRHFDAARRRPLGERPRDEDWLMTSAVAAGTAVELGDREAAATLYEQLLPYGDLNVSHLHMRHYVGSGHRFLGLLAGLLGRPEAPEHFERALEHNAELGARLAEIETRVDYARWLARPCASADERRRAQELARAATALAKETGATGLIARAHVPIG